MQRFGAEELLECYKRGVFPMADSREDPRIFLLDPEARGILPLDGLHISRSLKKFIRKMPFRVSFNEAFPSVIALCAEVAPDRENTWINEGIELLYSHLHEIGHAHSVEVWENDTLIGGLYGVSIGSAFFGESMFSRKTNASKVALVYLVERLNKQGFTLLDTQFLTDHLETMGAIEISREDYKSLLEKAIAIPASFKTNEKREPARHIP